MTFLMINTSSFSVKSKFSPGDSPSFSLTAFGIVICPFVVIFAVSTPTPARNYFPYFKCKELSVQYQGLDLPDLSGHSRGDPENGGTPTCSL